MKSTLMQVAQRLGIVIQLLLIEGGRLLAQRGRISLCTSLWIQAGEALRERHAAGKLEEAKQIAALAASVAVEDILVRVDIERGPGFLMQRTEANILPATCRPTDPAVLLQIIEQRYPSFECFDVLAHSVFSPPRPSVGEIRRHSQARMVGEEIFLTNATAGGVPEPESARIRRPLRLDANQ